MVARLSLLLIALLLAWPGSAAGGQSRDLAADDPAAGTASHASVVDWGDGRRSLKVDFPWQVYSQPSVEVRLVTGKDPGPTVVRPLFFVREYLKGEFLVDVYRCQDAGANLETRKSRTQNEVTFEILGRRNSLGTTSVSVLRRYVPTDGAAGATAVFCLLPPYAMDRQLLYLDLPSEEFAEPGRLYVWFLREGTILWSETLDWRGSERPETPAAR